MKQSLFKKKLKQKKIQNGFPVAQKIPIENQHLTLNSIYVPIIRSFTNFNQQLFIQQQNQKKLNQLTPSQIDQMRQELESQLSTNFINRIRLRQNIVFQQTQYKQCAFKNRKTLIKMQNSHQFFDFVSILQKLYWKKDQKKLQFSYQLQIAQQQFKFSSKYFSLQKLSNIPLSYMYVVCYQLFQYLTDFYSHNLFLNIDSINICKFDWIYYLENELVIKRLIIKQKYVQSFIISYLKLKNQYIHTFSWQDSIDKILNIVKQFPVQIIITVLISLHYSKSKIYQILDPQFHQILTDLNCQHQNKYINFQLTVRNWKHYYMIDLPNQYIPQFNQGKSLKKKLINLQHLYLVCIKQSQLTLLQALSKKINLSKSMKMEQQQSIIVILLNKILGRKINQQIKMTRKVEAFSNFMNGNSTDIQPFTSNIDDYSFLSKNFLTYFTFYLIPSESNIKYFSNNLFKSNLQFIDQLLNKRIDIVRLIARKWMQDSFGQQIHSKIIFWIGRKGDNGRYIWDEIIERYIFLFIEVIDEVFGSVNQYVIPKQNKQRLKQILSPLIQYKGSFLYNFIMN